MLQEVRSCNRKLITTAVIMMQQVPSSAFFTSAWTHHVFLSFNGSDTRYGFTNNLHRALDKNGIRSFIDHENLNLGEEISPALVKAIEQSRIAIIVFSENYASSTFCLNELVKILECIKKKGRLVWPIFYKVHPSDVRHQTRSYKEAFKKYEKRFGSNNDKVRSWKTALYKASNLKGEYFNRDQYEYDFITKIVQQLSRIINRKPLHISANYLVGLELQIQNVISLLDDRNHEVKCMVGICGIGGIGKSTIARVLFNLIADQFEGLCFLTGVRENSINKGLVKLQQTLLFEILGGEHMEFMDVDTGAGIIKDRLQQKKVLLILDDVDGSRQLQTLAGGLDWFGPGSRVIITTRNKHLLRIHGVERIYEVEELNDAEAYKLFCWSAFKKNEVDPCHEVILMRAISYCQGLPLALDIIGCNLFGKEPEECESALDSYERIPNKDIQKILKVSYDSLEENEKVIFLDMACFFKGYQLRCVEDILLRGRGFDPKYGIGVLVEKSLIKIGTREQYISMHALIQDMGKEIVRKQSRLKPGGRSRLWWYKDILHVLEENMGTDKIEFIMLDLPKDEEVQWDAKAFKDMKSLRVLIIKNARFSEAPEYLPSSLRILHWEGYSSPSFPSNFRPRELSILNLRKSHLVLDKPLQKFQSLSLLDLKESKILQEVPDISRLPNLTTLNLIGCIHITKIHDSVGHLVRLRELDATGCRNLKILPHFMKSTSLHRLELSGCYNLKIIPEKFESCTSIHLYGSIIVGPIGVVPRGFEYSALTIPGPSGKFALTSSVSMLPIVDKLVAGCHEWSSKVSSFTIQCCDFSDEVPVTWLSSFSNLAYLKPTYNDYHWIRKLFCAQFPCFSNLVGLDLTENFLTDEFLSTRLPWFTNLTELDLTANDFTVLPECINQYCCLRKLVLNRCSMLREISVIPSSIKHLSAKDCFSLSSQSKSILQSHELHEVGGTFFLLPGSIPDWFHHYCRGSSLSFWFRKKFPLIALSLVLLRDWPYYGIVLVKVHVNGREIECQTIPNFGYILRDHICLFDLKNIFESLWSQADAMQGRINDGWNHVEIKVQPNGFRDLGWIKELGVYVYKQNPNIDDVRFTNPDTERECV